MQLYHNPSEIRNTSLAGQTGDSCSRSSAESCINNLLRKSGRSKTHLGRGSIRFTVFLGKQLLAGRIDVRADSVFGDPSDCGPLDDCVTLGLLDDGPVDGFVKRSITGHQLSDSFEEILLFPGQRDIFEPMVLPIVDGEHLDGAVAL